MQCGCECIACTEDIAGDNVTTGAESCRDVLQLDSNIYDYSSAATCTARNESRCGVDFSTPDQARYCSIEQPAQWVPVYDIGNGLDYSASGNYFIDYGDFGRPRDDYSESDDDEESFPSTQFLYTAQSELSLIHI